MWSCYHKNTETVLIPLLTKHLSAGHAETADWWWCYLNWVLTAIYLPHDLGGVSSLAAPYSSNHNYANCAYSTHSWSWQLYIYTPAPALMWTVIRKQSWSVALCLSVQSHFHHFRERTIASYHKPIMHSQPCLSGTIFPFSCRYLQF